MYTQDYSAFEQYHADCDDPMKYPLRMLCKVHGLQRVASSSVAEQIVGEGGEGRRLNYVFSMGCGCSRGKGLEEKN